MTDTDLANKIMALGVGEIDPRGAYLIRGQWNECAESGDYVSTYEFVRDWRVTGALIEKCQKIYIEYIGDPEQTAVALTVYARAENNRTWDWKFGESLPRTINEATVEALT